MRILTKRKKKKKKKEKEKEKEKRKRKRKKKRKRKRKKETSRSSSLSLFRLHLSNPLRPQRRQIIVSHVRVCVCLCVCVFVCFPEQERSIGAGGFSMEFYIVWLYGWLGPGFVKLKTTSKAKKALQIQTTEQISFSTPNTHTHFILHS